MFVTFVFLLYRISIVLRAEREYRFPLVQNITYTAARLNLRPSPLFSFSFSIGLSAPGKAVNELFDCGVIIPDVQQQQSAGARVDTRPQCGQCCYGRGAGPYDIGRRTAAGEMSPVFVMSVARRDLLGLYTKIKVK